MSDSTVEADTAGKASFARAAVILLGVIGGIQVTDPIIASVSLVRASDALDFTASIQALAAGISTLALAATVIPGGVIADRYGRRQVLMVALLVGSLGQLITAFAPATGLYLLGRVIAGMAMGVLFGASYALLREVAGKALGPAMGLYNVASVVVALSFGFVGGALATASWRLSFMLLPVLSVICFFIVPKVLPKVPPLKHVSRDYLGMILVGIGVAGVLYGISNAAVDIANPKCWLPILIGFVSFAAFAILESKLKDPVFPIRLLAHPAFLGTVIMGIFWNLANGSITQMLANIWQYVFDWNTVQVSLGQLPMSVAGIAGSLIAGAMIGKGKKIVTVAASGYILMVVGFLFMLLVSPTSGFLVFLPGMFLAGFGWMTSATSQGTSWIALSPARFFGPVTSSKLTVGQFGYALGLSGSTALVSLFTLKGVSNATNGAVSGDGAWAQIGDYLKTGKSSIPELSQLTRGEIGGLYVDAFKLTSLIIAIILVIAGLLMWFLLRSKKASIPVDEWLGDEPAEPAAAASA